MKSGWGLGLLLTLSSLLLFSAVLLGETNTTKDRVVPELKAYRINPHAPSIDGELDDPVWQSEKLHFAQEFTQMEPDEGKAPTESTVVAVCYDDEAIYFAFWNYDSEPDKIQRQLVRRDRWSQSDLVSVRLDPYHDHLTGYRFDVNACNVQRDFRLYNDANIDGDWDAVWESAVKTQPWGWTAEIKIPYHCLRFNEKENQTWGMNVTRYISRKDEADWWAFSPSTEGGLVSRFGHLTDLTAIKPMTHMEIMPYAVSGYNNEPKSIGNPDGRDYMENIGFDLKYGISSNLTLDATINPDFGQVELDQPVLNLSAFETFFPEKRPFFLEGANMFSTPFMLFYSRRIGGAPYRDVDTDQDHFFTDYPGVTTILGASKLTGKIGGTSVNFLNAVTQSETAKYVTFSVDEATDEIIPHDTLEGEVEPEAAYSVLRVKQDVFANSQVGLLLTSANQNQSYPAVTGGIDWRLFTNNAVWGLDGQMVFSQDDGQYFGYTRDGVRYVDKDHTGFGFNCSIEKTAGKHVCGRLGVTIKNPYLYLNRLGYTGRNDQRHVFGWIQYRTQDDWFIFRNTYHNFNFTIGENYDHVNIQRNGNYNAFIQFVNNWGLGYGINIGRDVYDDYETRGNGLWKKPESWSWWASLETDCRKPVTFNLNPGSGEARNGTWWAHYTGISVRPRSNMEYSFGVNYERLFGATRWVYNSGDSILMADGVTYKQGQLPIFADLDQDEVSFYLSASIMLRPNLSFQVSGQGYITGLDYKDYKAYYGSDDSYAAVAPSNFNRNYSALNSTMIVRWEYLPGSTLYFVWTRAMSDTQRGISDVDLNRDISKLFSSGSRNIWLVKASYWWNI